MEEMKKEKILMLWEKLQDKFNMKQWKKIKQLPCHVFVKIQQRIVEQLMRDQKLYDKYFKNFYNNHVKLLNWYMLATEKKAEIQPYVFKTLVNNGMVFYNQKIKEVFEDKFKRVLPPKNAQTLKQIQTMQEEVYRDFFNDLLNRNRIQNVHKPLNLKLYGSRNLQEKQTKNLDGHDFYIQTFNACNGWKYIFYNYEKHMQGLSEKVKYNQKIRQRDNKSPFERKQNASLKLTDFQHEQFGSQKCKVEKICKIFANRTAQSAQQLKKLAHKDEIKKIVFINHQGKPNTYLISRKHKKML